MISNSPLASNWTVTPNLNNPLKQWMHKLDLRVFIWCLANNSNLTTTVSMVK